MVTGCVPQDGEEGEGQMEGKKRGSDLLQRCLDSPTLPAYACLFPFCSSSIHPCPRAQVLPVPLTHGSIKDMLRTWQNEV